LFDSYSKLSSNAFARAHRNSPRWLKFNKSHA
jgi:hypothetical protein